MRFESTELAVQCTNQCENGAIMFNNSILFHPSYCKLVEPKANKQVDQEYTNIEFNGIFMLYNIWIDVHRVSGIVEEQFPFSFSDDFNNTEKIVSAINLFLSSQYNTLVVYPLDPNCPQSVFLEHHLYGDEYTITVVSEQSGNSKWKMHIPHENGINEYQCEFDFFTVKEQSRFCRNVIITSEAKATAVVATTVLILPLKLKSWKAEKLESSPIDSKNTLQL